MKNVLFSLYSCIVHVNLSISTIIYMANFHLTQWPMPCHWLLRSSVIDLNFRVGLCPTLSLVSGVMSNFEVGYCVEAVPMPGSWVTTFDVLDLVGFSPGSDCATCGPQCALRIGLHSHQRTHNWLGTRSVVWQLTSFILYPFWKISIRPAMLS